MKYLKLFIIVLLFSITTTYLVGCKGKKGNSVVSIINIELNDKNEFIFTFSNGTIKNLGVIEGSDESKEVTFRVNDGYLQWQYIGDAEWKNLLEVSDVSNNISDECSDGLYFTEVSGEGYGVTGYDGNDADVVIPAMYNSKRVTYIANQAFMYKSDMTSITIPDSVTKIGRSAFSGCSSLTSINIPDSITSIGDYAFEGCSNLKSVVIGNGVTNIGSFAFYNCSSLTSINIPNSVTGFKSSTFSGCISLTSINIPNSVTNIGISTFSGCYKLTSINIPDSVTSIGNITFSGCSSLTSIIFRKV
jgi:hypothetical protein